MSKKTNRKHMDAKQKLDALMKALKDASEATEPTEETPKVEETPKEETPTEEVSEDKKVDDVAEKIASKFAEALKASKESEADTQKKKELAFGDVALNDYDVKIDTLRSGKEVSIKHSEATTLGGWYKSFLNKDRGGMLAYHQKLEPLVEGINADGGFLVPTLMYSKITQLIEDMAIIKPRAEIIDMTGMKTNQLDINGIASNPIVSWGSENADKATSSMTFNQINLTPYKLAAIIPVSTELRDDAPANIISIVTRAFAQAVAKEEDRAFMVGTGAGQPTGIDTYVFTLYNAGGALAFNHLNSAYFGLAQAFRNKAVWIMNGRTMAGVANLVDTQNRPILSMDGIVTKAGLPTIKGAVVLEQNDVASDRIFFIDLKQYYIGIRLPMTIDIADQATIGSGANSISLWQRNLIGIRIEERVDAEISTTRCASEISNTGIS